jgi:nucleotide-binding universal stress UspA family protein
MSLMRVVVWVVENTWQACLDASAEYTPPDAEVTVLHVIPAEPEMAAHHAYDALLGRHPRPGDPAEQIAQTALAEQQTLLDAVVRSLARPARLEPRQGRAEQEVVAAAEGADLLVLARDGDLRHLGPASIGPATRFVVDHAPCQLLLVWPIAPPHPASLPLPHHTHRGRHHPGASTPDPSPRSRRSIARRDRDPCISGERGVAGILKSAIRDRASVLSRLRRSSTRSAVPSTETEVALAAITFQQRRIHKPLNGQDQRGRVTQLIQASDADPTARAVGILVDPCGHRPFVCSAQPNG